MVLKTYYLFFILIFCSCSTETNSNELNSNLKKIDSIRLYTLKCASCHGMNGNLGAGGAKDLSISELTDNEIRSIIANGRSPMPSFKSSLSSDEIDEVMNFIKNLRK